MQHGTSWNEVFNYRVIVSMGPVIGGVKLRKDYISRVNLSERVTVIKKMYIELLPPFLKILIDTETEALHSASTAPISRRDGTIMRVPFLVRAILLFFVSSMAICATDAKHSRPRSAVVRFLATSTSVRNSWGTSQDVYLVEIIPRGTHEPELARLVDDHPYYHEVVLTKDFASTTGTTLKIWRDPTCDIEFEEVPLRTAPGDPMAILPERLGFQPMLGRSRFGRDFALLPNDQVTAHHQRFQLGSEPKAKQFCRNTSSLESAIRQSRKDESNSIGLPQDIPPSTDEEHFIDNFHRVQLFRAQFCQAPKTLGGACARLSPTSRRSGGRPSA